jgi:hypothetical protein
MKLLDKYYNKNYMYLVKQLHQKVTEGLNQA